MKRNIKISAIIGAMILCGAMSVHAQNRHEISFSGFGGMSNLKYEATFGNPKIGFGGGFGLGYQVFFSPQWGLGTGAEFAFFNAGYNLDGIDLRYPTKDMDGNAFVFSSKAGKYEETQSAGLVQIPLMLQFQTGDNHQFFVAFGGKAGIPVTAKYKTSALSIQNSGFYAEENYEYATRKFMGFGLFNIPADNSELKFKTAFFFSAEIGGKFRLTDANKLYIGVFLDYGLNNIVETQNLASLPHFIEYNSQNPREFAVNSILQSKSTEAFTEKLSPMAVGIKLRLAFGKGSIEQK